MTDWKWYSGPDSEEFTNGPFATREEAVKELDGEVGYVILARKAPLRLSQFFNGMEFMETAEEAAYELANESGDPVFDLTKDQIDGLQYCVRSAIEKWQNAHRLTFVPWTFTETKELEKIE